MFFSYGSNPPLYPSWQEYFRKYQPPMLIVWGKNDKIFPPPGPNLTSATSKTWSFICSTRAISPSEDSVNEIADLMLKFLDKHARRTIGDCERPL